MLEWCEITWLATEEKCSIKIVGDFVEKVARITLLRIVIFERKDGMGCVRDD